MVAVAIVGLVSGGVVLQRRSRVYEAHAQRHANRAAWLIRMADNDDRTRAEYPRRVAEYEAAKQSGDRRRIFNAWNQLPRHGLSPIRTPYRAQAAEHRSAEELYRRAARYPWLPFLLHPPEPDW